MSSEERMLCKARDETERVAGVVGGATGGG